MADRVADILAQLQDPSRYVRVRQVPVFDEHTDVVWVKEGRIVPEGTAGAKRTVHRFDRARLERLARNCNARTRGGSLIPLTIGHTDPDNPDERAQPDHVGYAINYRVGFDPRRRKYMLYADYHFARECYDTARRYPRTSVELWPEGEHEFFDPISLLKRTPQRDLEQWTYGRTGKLVLRYSMRTTAMPMPPTPPPSDELSPDEVEQFERHCASHPLYARYHAMKAKRFAMPDEPPPDEDALLEDPTDFPDADEPMPGDDADLGAYLGDEEPIRQGAAFASGTNGNFPAGAPNPAKSKQYRREATSIRLARLERELAQAKQYARQAARERDEAEARRLVNQLVAEGIDLDPAEEVPELMNLDASGREKRAEHIRRRYQRSPTFPTGRVDLAREEPANPGDQISPAHYDRALQYLRKHGCSYDEAVQKTRTN